MGSLQDELLKIRKDVIKKEPAEPKAQDSVRASSPSPTKKQDSAPPYKSHRTIQCKFCGKDVLAHLIKQHNIALHQKNFTDKQTATHQQNDSQKTVSVRTTVVGSQEVTYTRKLTNNSDQESSSPSQEKMGLADTQNTEVGDLKFVSSYQLSSAQDFKMPDRWVLEDYKPNHGENFDITIGLDFGTSYTKACVRFGHDHFIVDWSGISDFKDKYTLPSEISYFEDGSFQIGRSSDAILVASSLKIPLLEKNQDADSCSNAVNYLGLTLHYIRSWWFYTHGSISKDFTLNWIVNIGAPSKQYEESYWTNKYKKIVSEAWTKSFINGKKPSEIHDDNISVIPEFVAEIASYTKSQQRQPDLHLLIDIGGGTVDIVTFNIHKIEGDEELFPKFASDVVNLGTHYLMSERIQKCSLPENNFTSMEVLTTSDFSNLYNVAIEEVEAIDLAYEDKIKNKIIKVLDLTKQRRYYASPNWASGIRTFVCGGGSYSSIYRDAISKVQGRYNLLPINLPIPANVFPADFSKEKFHRISVAYGLSFNEMSLGIIRKEQDVDDAPRQELPMRPSYEDFYST